MERSSDLEAIGELAASWRVERSERQARRHLDGRDFDALRDANLWLSVVPQDMGGLWRGADRSVRPLCEALRNLAGADPSTSLVAAMHPSVIAFWLFSPDPADAAWEEQRRAVFATAAAGDQWGTIISEPGSGGDLNRTRAFAVPTDAEHALPGRPYLVTGDKHFGSGSGVTDWMITSAVPEGETEPALFALPVRDRPWDGTAGLKLMAEWDGMGMAATQSHSMRLEACPAVRLAWNGGLQAIARAAGPFVAMVFTAVVLGILDEAVELARPRLRGKGDDLRAYEKVEWARAEQDHWLAVQAYEGGLRTLEHGRLIPAPHDALRAKQAVADLAEQTLLRLTRVLGGGTFSRRSPFAHWFEDVRALGFLRPPWALAYDNLFATSLEEDESGGEA